MNLLFAINGGYIPTFLGCMRSVLLHGGASHYEVFILHSDLTDGDEADIRTALPDVDFHFVFVDPAMFDGFPESKRYPRQIYYRIAAPLLLPDTLERILYLDADTVIINPLTTLYATPFGDAYFMACTHTRKLLEKLNAARLGMDEAAPYINTGVLLYNLPALRADLDMERVRAFADEKQDVFLLPDQDILTALYGDRFTCSTAWSIISATASSRCTTRSCETPRSTSTGCARTRSSSTTAAGSSRGNRTMSAYSTCFTTS